MTRGVKELTREADKRGRPGLRGKLPRAQRYHLVFRLLEWALEPQKLDPSFCRPLLVKLARSAENLRCYLLPPPPKI